MIIKTKRIYEAADESDGFRILVDRLWPRGLKKDDIHIDKWLKEVAPSAELRKWFNHEPGKWEQFIQKYRSEISDLHVFEELRSDVKKHKTVTLLFAAKDEEHNNAVALANFLKSN